ncbi:hypothetical protein [Candidatus Solincola sp.]|jgi:hypothetical protein|nr:hypothetical protein [Actinomycetota bacterium]MDI7252389.1 hypothetical protein [Actinomycetota bacterium]
MNDKQSGAARWLTALAVVFIPLSIIILISGSWLANFTSNQWTRYLLFASWVTLTLSIVLGVVNMVGRAGDGSPSAGTEESEGEGGGEGETVSGAAPSGMDMERYRVEQALLLGQATAFLLGLFLYVAFISWMVLPKIGLAGL